jgi:hypothetical protein
MFEREDDETCDRVIDHRNMMLWFFAVLI